MGGCRCTYRNCTVRSNGVTHMFHYPVFDKVRCHQWLTNAQRLDFLNLKVSQLKNRVICQHHFDDECFMNFKKEKLKFEAVPTLDGPYCTPKEEKILSSDKMLPIILDDIENEFLSLSDKRANFSVKYVDFLTNNDLEDVDLSNNDNKLKHVTAGESVHKQIENSLRKLRQKNENQNTIPENNNTDSSKENLNLTLLNSPVTVNVEFVSHGIGKENSNQCNVENTSDKAIKKCILHESSIPYNPTISMDMNTKEIMSSSHNHNISLNNASNSMPSLESDIPPTQLQTKTETVNPNPKKSKVIQILEQRNISTYIPIPKCLQPLSPSGILRLPIKNINNYDKNALDSKITAVTTTVNTNNQSINFQPNMDLNSNIDANANIDIAPGIYNVPVILQSEENNEKITLSDLNVQSEISDIKDIQPTNSQRTVKQSSKSLLKSKINAEQLASIKEKRKFNMKLRDVIELCLDKQDNNKMANNVKNNIKVNTKNVNNKRTKDSPDKELKTNINRLKNSSVSSLLSKEPHLPSVGEYSIAYLEARMKRMEDILLNKIDQNSQRIVELKNTMGKSQSKTVQTQTTFTEETYKKFLYNEISKYLTTDANSLIYEQLFINCSAPKLNKVSPTPKKRIKR